MRCWRELVIDTWGALAYRPGLPAGGRWTVDVATTGSRRRVVGAAMFTECVAL